MTETTPQATTAQPEIRWKLSQHGSRLVHGLPDAVLAVLFAFPLAVGLIPPDWVVGIPPGFMEGFGWLLFVLVAEGAFMLMQGSLIDIATRLKKRPHIIVIVLIMGVLVLFLGHPLELLRHAWGEGMLVFLPLLFSLGERAAVLWRMPGRPRIEKVAARALVSNRITTGLALGALFVAVSILASDPGWAIFAAGALYFGIAAFDDYRVRGPRFAEKPTVLFRFDPIHIEYLEPL